MADQVAGPGGRPTVVVVGGGVAGLAAAWELTGGDGPGRPDAPAVVVLEASERLGGKLRTAAFAGGPVDVGPDGFLGRRPEAAALCRAVGLDDDLVPIAASGASVWARGRRRPLPAGLLLGVPTRVGPVARSGILSAAGALRLIGDLVAPRPDRRGPLGDRAIGPLVAHKLGRQVVERLVDPMLGGIHAGGVADASAAAVFPALLAAAQGQGSFMRALRRAPGASAPPPAPAASAADRGTMVRLATAPAQGAKDTPPAFWALRGGLESLVDALAHHLCERGAQLRTGTAAMALRRPGLGERPGGWVLDTTAGEIRADAVVLAVPAEPAADLLEPHDADVAALLRAVEYASVGVVTLSYPEAAVPDDLFGTGLLVPAGTPVPDHGSGSAAPEPCMVTACTYLWAKWPHLARRGERLVRASIGRFGDRRFSDLSDEELAGRVARELGALAGLAGRPTSALVTRWPNALPQYRVHHLLRVAGAEATVARLGGLALAGAAYHGVGIPACVGSGRRAAAEVLARLAHESEHAAPPAPA